MSNIVERPIPQSSITAAASRIAGTDIKSKRMSQGGSAKKDNWQDDAWDMYDLVGEQRFIVTSIASQLSKAKLYVGRAVPGSSPERIDQNTGEDDTRSDTDRLAQDILAAFGSSEAGRAQILQRLAVNLSVPGEGWLVGIPSDGLSGDDLSPEGLVITQQIGEEQPRELVPEELEWRMLSGSEVETNATSGNIEISLDDGEKQEYHPDDIYLIRVWRPHPRRWWEADSPTRASLPVLKELVGLTMHVSAQVDSRLAGAGLLALPQSVQRALAEQAGANPDEAGDQFTESLIEAMLTPVSDRASASALVPLVVTVPDEAAALIRHITFSQPLDAEARELRDEAIRRLALGMDAPPEMLLGLSTGNHWSAWAVQAETVATHIEPVLSLICDALTTQYLWPALVNAGVPEDEAQEYVIWYDVDHLIARPNLGADALALHERGVIGDDVLRRAHGYDDSDAPEPVQEDQALNVVMEMIRTAPSLAQTIGIPTLVDQLRAVLSGDVAAVEEVEDPVGDGDAETPEETPPSSSEGTDTRGGGGVPGTDRDPAELPRE